MSKPAPVFRPISAPLDVPDEELNALGDKLGVPTMVRPEPPPAPVYGAPPAKPPSNGASEARPEALNSPSPTSAEEKAPCPQEKLTITLPAYLAHALRRDCAEKRLTQRFLVLQGLQAIGYEIDPVDLVPDHRRPQSKAGRT